eukprot:jgi/Mesvir1/18174/Mv09465-RA.4
MHATASLGLEGSITFSLLSKIRNQIFLMIAHSLVASPHKPQTMAYSACSSLRCMRRFSVRLANASLTLSAARMDEPAPQVPGAPPAPPLLPVVLDIDLTVLHASSLSDLQKKAREPKLNKRLLEEDYEMLRLFSKKNYVETRQNGASIRWSARPEDRVLADKVVSRPVIRMADGRIFTRIDPKVADTSMLVYLRPRLDDRLLGYLQRHRQQLRVFVSTAGEKEYAAEMWRLLDPQQLLIPQEHMGARFLSVWDRAQAAQKGAGGSQKGIKRLDDFSIDGRGPVIILDDKRDAWQEQDRAHVLEVQEFNPYSYNTQDVEESSGIRHMADYLEMRHKEWLASTGQQRIETPDEPQHAGGMDGRAAEATNPPSANSAPSSADIAAEPPPKQAEDASIRDKAAAGPPGRGGRASDEPQQRLQPPARKRPLPNGVATPGTASAPKPTSFLDQLTGNLRKMKEGQLPPMTAPQPVSRSGTLTPVRPPSRGAERERTVDSPSPLRAGGSEGGPDRVGSVPCGPGAVSSRDVTLRDDSGNGTRAGDGAPVIAANDGVRRTASGDGLGRTSSGDGVGRPSPGNGLITGPTKDGVVRAGNAGVTVARPVDGIPPPSSSPAAPAATALTIDMRNASNQPAPVASGRPAPVASNEPTVSASCGPVVSARDGPAAVASNNGTSPSASCGPVMSARDGPAPVASNNGPSPSASCGPVMSARDGPAPVASYNGPSPSASCGPVMSARDGPAPVASNNGPSPSASCGPVMSARDGPAPVASNNGPSPSASCGPVMSARDGPAPVASYNGATPSANSGPALTGSSGPSSSASDGPETSTSSGPSPVAGSRPAPVSTSGSSPVAGSRPAPVASSGPSPVAGSKPAPVGSSRPSPVAGSRPAPVATSGPVAVASSNPTSVTPDGCGGKARDNPVDATVDVVKSREATPARGMDGSEASAATPVVDRQQERNAGASGTDAGQRRDVAGAGVGPVCENHCISLTSSDGCDDRVANVRQDEEVGNRRTDAGTSRLDDRGPASGPKRARVEMDLNDSFELASGREGGAGGTHEADRSKGKGGALTRASASVGAKRHKARGRSIEDAICIDSDDDEDMAEGGGEQRDEDDGDEPHRVGADSSAYHAK